VDRIRSSADRRRFVNPRRQYNGIITRCVMVRITGRRIRRGGFSIAV